jgi:hypothetical protein
MDVNGLYRRNVWPIREKKKTHDKLFYVFALVPGDTYKVSIFHSHGEWGQMIKIVLSNVLVHAC